MRRISTPKPFQGIALKAAGVFDIGATQSPRSVVLHSKGGRPKDATSIRKDWRQIGGDIKRTMVRAK
jgi:hypothetical protein